MLHEDSLEAAGVPVGEDLYANGVLIVKHPSEVSIANCHNYFILFE